MTMTTQRDTSAVYVMSCSLNTKCPVPEVVVDVDEIVGFSFVVVVVVAAAA